MCRTTLYNRWNCMLTRCFNEKAINYERYGGRGITVCERWLKFDNFRDDMQDGFSQELQLDRRDNDADYSPENCFWATKKQQARNKRDSRVLTFDGISASAAEWAERTGIKSATILGRLRAGWNIADALTKSVRKWPAVATIVVAVFLMSQDAQAQVVPRCLARVGSASGVVLHPDGYIASAEHVTRSEGSTVDVEVCGQKYVGRIIHDPPVDGIDGVVVVKIEASHLWRARIASEEPTEADPCIAFGYPHGKFRRTEGIIDKVGDTLGAYRLPDGYESDVFIQPGNSGGPLFNSKNELIGLCHGVELNPATLEMVRSYWIGLKQIRAVVNWTNKSTTNGTQLVQQRKKIIYVITKPNCPPCAKIKADVAAGKYEGLDIRFIDSRDPKAMEIVRRQGALTYRDYDGNGWKKGATTTTTQIPRLAPLIWVEGQKQVQVGYTASSFVGFLKFVGYDVPVAILRFIGDVVFGPGPEPTPAPTPAPIPDPDPTPFDEPPPGEAGAIPEGEPVAEMPMPDLGSLPFGGGLPPTPQEIADVTELDMSGVEFYVVANEFLNMSPDLKRLLINDLSGPLQSEVKSRSDGKASLAIVAKVATPHRFDLFCAAAQASVDKIAVFMVIPEANVGFVKGAAIKLAETKFKPLIDKYLQGVSSVFVPVLERVQVEQVAAMRAAANTPEPARVDPVTGEPVPEETPWWYGLLAGIIPAIRESIKKRVKA